MYPAPCKEILATNGAELLLGTERMKGEPEKKQKARAGMPKAGGARSHARRGGTLIEHSKKT